MLNLAKAVIIIPTLAILGVVSILITVTCVLLINLFDYEIKF